MHMFEAAVGWECSPVIVSVKRIAFFCASSDDFQLKLQLGLTTEASLDRFGSSVSLNI